MVYKLDVSREEYRDDYAKEKESGELWQIYARNQLVSNLSSILKDAEKYKFTRSEGGNKDTWLSHNAILVTSPRGSGKTVFLRNSKHMWNSSQQGKEECGKLFFLDVIDPTMLMDNDSFANVIIAQIYQAVSGHFNKKSNICSKARDEFHHSLKRLSDSMGKSSEFDGSIGIDKILKYSSGIQVENKFHHFVESAIKVLGCSAIVVLIDDVDMALENAFEVVDEVRRYLGCPYIIPIVSGDLKLYEHMTQVRFDDRAYSNYCRDVELRKDGIQLSSELTTAYLTKVFPSHTRITLFPIENLLSQMEIIESDNREKDSINIMPYSLYREKLFNKFNYLCHNRDSRKEQFTPRSARELTQLVRTIKPSELKDVEQTDTELMSLYIKNKGWAAQQKQGDAFANTESAIALNYDRDKSFNIHRLLAFNIKAQSDLVVYPWASYPVYESQLEALDLLPSRGGKDVKNKHLLDNIFDEKSRILKSMPPLEFLVSDLFISKKVIEGNKSCSVLISGDDLPENVNHPDILISDGESKESEITERKVDVKYSVESVLLDIYTEGELYSTLNNTKRFVLFSRAFELLFYSFVKNESELSYDVVDEIVKKKPFYSIVSFSETKISIDGDNEEIIDELDKGRSSLALFGEIVKWKREYSSKLNKMDSFKLVPIFTYIFNGVFTAINVIKANYSSSKSSKNNTDNYRNEHLSDMVLRFKYNLLNAVLRAGINGEAVYANVLIGAKSETVRDVGEVISRDKTYTRNKARLESEIDRFTKAVDLEKSQRLQEVMMLHDAIEQHPIFSILCSEDGLYAPTLKLGGISKKDSQDETKQALKTLFGSAIDDANHILNDILSNRVKTLSTFRDKLKEVSDVEEIERAIVAAKENLPQGFEQEDSYKVLDERIQNFIKAISGYGNQDAKN
ncbi:hypothetical protein [Enterovibrio norvegicus]|uniref:hypothetical protein n=1 Tax=Enterovibrio norvegicus TaxID=188144 RepID=UPI000C84D993|nr:hypothetical protein [Enterovibrio norvegicus]PMI26200.1 hypothetical protein BCU47_04520 [Enterovibrio norvegicus]